MNEKLKMTDNNAEVIRMKRKYQWILCAGLIIFVIAAFCVLVSKDNNRVAESDMGKVIGKQGRIAKAIRTVVKAAASRENKKVAVEILQ